MDGVVAYQSGVPGVVGQLCREIGLVDVIDQAAEWHKQAKMSPGERILALLLCIFTDRHALWRIEEFYERHDVEALFGEGVSSADFNDDALARALDKLHAAGAQGVMATLAMRALSAEGMPLEGPVRVDTMTVSLFGEYEKEEDGAIKIAYGHAKSNNRPGCKQIEIGAASVGPGMPLASRVLDGNASDKTFNFEMLEDLSHQLSLEDLQRLVYIADSQMVTQANLQRVDLLGWRFISRLPSNYTLCDEVKERALALGVWQDVGRLSPDKEAASYRVQEFEETLYNRPYRLVVVHSSSLEKGKKERLERAVARELEAIEQQVNQFAKKLYGCAADAQAALDTFLKKPPRFWSYAARVDQVEVTLKRPGRGRPKKGDAPLRETRYRVILTLGARQEAEIQQEKDRLSTFVLISNVPKKDKPAADILRDYHGQFLAEQNWRFLKVPWHLAPVFLKLPRRVESFAYVLLFALIIYRLIQHRARAALATDPVQKQMLLPGKIWRDTPTSQQLLDMLQTVQVIVSRGAFGRTQRTLGRMRPEVRRIFDLLRVNPQTLETVT